MKEIFREYKESDYKQCEELVNQAWRFNDVFSPKALSDISKLIYTKGSVLGSNYKMVVEVNGKVIGFIFGLNEHADKPGNNILFGLEILWKLIWIKGKKPDKSNLLNALKVHENNRTKIVSRGRSEIVLFVVSKAFQGKGIGKKLWSGFKNICIGSGVTSVIVETNKLGASSFYEQIGFRHLENFDSPLHEFATKGGQACIYDYTFK
ncbi:MAG: GNAT family N-acetyltransferase [Campylobacterota bacterium]|nr:GNAT family N-acetyltransferase [Campylobacterota bacterium]